MPNLRGGQETQTWDNTLLQPLIASTVNIVNCSNGVKEKVSKCKKKDSGKTAIGLAEPTDINNCMYDHSLETKLA
jgi:hypothetical protein